MASIVVSGDTSGAVTLSAPSVAGTTTVTLPSSTGTMALLQTPSFATTIGVGGTTASASGSGISFPATQSASSDANTLDDYEEGNWTPSVGGTATYSGQSGRYTKIGNFVCAVCDMTINVIGSGSTTTVSGLPFTAGSLNFGGSVSYWNQTSRGLYFLAPQISGSTFWFIDTTSAMTTPNNSVGIFQNGTRVIVTVTYTVY